MLNNLQIQKPFTDFNLLIHEKEFADGKEN